MRKLITDPVFIFLIVFCTGLSFALFTQPIRIYVGVLIGLMIAVIFGKILAFVFRKIKQKLHSLNPILLAVILFLVWLGMIFFILTVIKGSTDFIRDPQAYNLGGSDSDRYFYPWDIVGFVAFLIAVFGTSIIATSMEKMKFATWFLSASSIIIINTLLSWLMNFGRNPKYPYPIMVSLIPSLIALIVTRIVSKLDENKSP